MVGGRPCCNAVFEQMLDNSAAKKSGSTENGNKSPVIRCVMFEAFRHGSQLSYSSRP